jgi:fermentation-respiration switch protein FrsA (DUF1100 family)
MLKLLLYLVAGYLGYMLLGYLGQRSIIYPRHLVAPPVGSGPREADVEQLWLRAGTNKAVEAWLFPGEGRSAQAPGPALMLFKGNGELVDNRLEDARRFQSWGLTVLVPEYRGYGRAGGWPSEAGIIADMEAFYDELARRPEVDADAIVSYGWSLGGGIALGLSRTRKPAAVIIDSSFTSTAALARRYLLPPFLVRDSYRSDRAIQELDRPVLIFHGTRDSVIPFAHGRRLHELAPGSVFVPLDKDHNEPCPDEVACHAAMRSFLTEHGILAVCR